MVEELGKGHSHTMGVFHPKFHLLFVRGRTGAPSNHVQIAYPSGAPPPVAELIVIVSSANQAGGRSGDGEEETTSSIEMTWAQAYPIREGGGGGKTLGDVEFGGQVRSRRGGAVAALIALIQHPHHLLPRKNHSSISSSRTSARLCGSSSRRCRRGRCTEPTGPPSRRRARRAGLRIRGWQPTRGTGGLW